MVYELPEAKNPVLSAFWYQFICIDPTALAVSKAVSPGHIEMPAAIGAATEFTKTCTSLVSDSQEKAFREVT